MEPPAHHHPTVTPARHASLTECVVWTSSCVCDDGGCALFPMEGATPETVAVDDGFDQVQVTGGALGEELKKERT